MNDTLETIIEKIIRDAIADNLTKLMPTIAEQISVNLKDYLIEKPHNVAETAGYLGVHEQTLYKWIREAKIPSRLVHRIGSTHFFFLSELRDHLKKL